MIDKKYGGSVKEVKLVGRAEGAWNSRNWRSFAHSEFEVTNKMGSRKSLSKVE